MADRIDIPVKLKEQGKLHAFAHAAVFHKHALIIQRFLQNLRSEPFRNKSNLQITAVAVVGDGTEIYNAVRIERGRFTLCIKADADRTGDGFRLFIGKRCHAIRDRFRHLGCVDIFQIIFDFVSHKNLPPVNVGSLPKANSDGDKTNFGLFRLCVAIASDFKLVKDFIQLF